MEDKNREEIKLATKIINFFSKIENKEENIVKNLKSSDDNNNKMSLNSSVEE